MSSPQTVLTTLWAGLERRQVLELAVPGATIGLLGGVIAGSVAAMVSMDPVTIVAVTLSLGISLAIAGFIYDILATSGRVPIGPLAPMALFWAIGFPIARVINAVVVSLVAGDAVAVPHGWLDYIVYNMLLSTGFAIGFWWFHQNYAPRWWFRLRDTNPVAAYVINDQLRFIGWQQEQRNEKRDGRRNRRAEKRSRRRGKRTSPSSTVDDRHGDTDLT